MESEKNGLSESEAEAEDPTNRKARNRTLSPFILPLLLVILTMQFSLDRKRRSHKRNRCSASVGLILTRLYHFTLLITTPDYNSVTSENQPLYGNSNHHMHICASGGDKKV